MFQQFLSGEEGSQRFMVQGGPTLPHVDRITQNIYLPKAFDANIAKFVYFENFIVPAILWF